MRKARYGLGWAWLCISCSVLCGCKSLPRKKEYGSLISERSRSARPQWLTAAALEADGSWFISGNSIILVNTGVGDLKLAMRQTPMLASKVLKWVRETSANPCIDLSLPSGESVSEKHLPHFLPNSGVIKDIYYEGKQEGNRTKYKLYSYIAPICHP